MGAPKCRWCKKDLGAVSPEPAVDGTETPAWNPFKDQPGDPWRELPFPKEIVPVVLIFVLHLTLLLMRPNSWVWLTAAEIAAIVGLLRRSIWGWWTALGVSIFMGGVVVVAVVRWPDRVDWTIAPAVMGGCVVSLVCLIVARARKAYVKRLAGEFSPPPPAAGRKTCPRCGRIFLPLENRAHREGFCSQRCLSSAG